MTTTTMTGTEKQIAAAAKIVPHVEAAFEAAKATLRSMMTDERRAALGSSAIEKLDALLGDLRAFGAAGFWLDVRDVINLKWDGGNVDVAARRLAEWAVTAARGTDRCEYLTSVWNCARRKAGA